MAFDPYAHAYVLTRSSSRKVANTSRVIVVASMLMVSQPCYEHTDKRSSSASDTHTLHKTARCVSGHNTLVSKFHGKVLAQAGMMDSWQPAATQTQSMHIVNKQTESVRL